MNELIPVKKPSRLPLLQEIRGTTLTLFAAEMLISKAVVVSEGETEAIDSAAHIYRGSTLISIDLDTVLFDLPKDSMSRERFKKAVSSSIMFRIRLLRLSRKEAERRAAPLFIREMRSDTIFRIVDNTLLIDIDIECPLADAIGDADLRKESSGE